MTDEQRSITGADDDGHYPGRRTVLRTTGALSALLATTGLVSGKSEADDEDDDGSEYGGDDMDEDDDDDGIPEAPLPGEPEEDVGEEASVRFDDQVTDGTFVVAEDVVVPTAGLLSIHQLVVEVDGEQFNYVNSVDGAPQFPIQTIVGYSDFLEPGIYDEVKVHVYADDDLLPVGDSGQDRLEDPQVLLALMHIDGNDNEEWDLFDTEDVADFAYDFGETRFAPPFDRPSDIAAVVPLEENAEEFEISR